MPTPTPTRLTWPAPGTVVVEWVPREELVAHPSWLAPDELERMRRQPAPLGVRWAAARCWVRERLAVRAGVPPRAIEVDVGPAGRPRFHHPLIPDAVDANVAHTDDVVALALAVGRVGIDVEEPPPAGEDLLGLAEVVATPAELDQLRGLAERSRPAAFQRWWVRKEALLKADGTGFLADPRRVHVGITVVAPASPWVVRDLGFLDGPGRPALAVATERSQPGGPPHHIVVSRRPAGGHVPP